MLVYMRASVLARMCMHVNVTEGDGMLTQDATDVDEHRESTGGVI